MDSIPNKHKHSRTGTLTGYSLYVLFLLMVCFYSFKKPAYNWDMLAYMSVVVSYDNSNTTEVHTKVYQLAKQELPIEKYQLLIDSTDKYKTSTALNASEFNLQLPFYVVKPLYTGIVYLFYKAGMPLTKSTAMPSVVGYFFIGLLLVYWLRKYLPPYAAIMLSSLIMLFSPMLQVAKLSTPDCLSAFFILWAIYFLVEKRSIAITFALLLISIFARLDNVILCVLLFPVLAITGMLKKKISMKQHLLFIALTAISYFAISYGATHYGWNALYYPSFSQHLNAGHNIHQAFSISSYLKLASTQIMVGLFFSWLPIFIFLIVLLCIKMDQSNNRKLGMDQVILLLLLFIIVLRFFLQPVIADRFYVPYYLVVIVFLIKRYAVLINGK